MKSSYQVVREYLIERVDYYRSNEYKWKREGKELPAYSVGLRDAYENVLSLMDFISPPTDGLKDALEALDMLYEDYEEGEAE